MPSTFDPLLRLELQATGENATTWGTKTNNNLNLIAAAIAGATPLSLSTADVSLTEANAAADQARAGILILTGTLLNSVNIVVPAQTKTYAVLRQTSGAFGVTIKNPSGTGATLAASGADLVVCTTATCVALVGNLNIQVSTLVTEISVLNAQVSTLNVQVSTLNALNIRITE